VFGADVAGDRGPTLVGDALEVSLVQAVDVLMAYDRAFGERLKRGGRRRT
jgi:hypothetical protein